ncbi:hypothetical protein KFE25_000434 [Diacronema lutheri]|uniref:Nucleotide-diphospho-sugar transferase domain-containing protein n=1 Tax=Diacronema lutheri TaxID=2081491 RepID=A0A8J5XH43_DIALT|nr:hypothetical protein KFE25_000434 [Diacronema lutheri]
MEDERDESESLVDTPPAPPAKARAPRCERRTSAVCCCVLLALACASAGAWWYRVSRPCYNRRFAYATMITKHVGTGELSPCYKAALAMLLTSWLATNSTYPFLLMTTAELDEGLQAIIDERPGAIIPLRVAQLQTETAKRGDLGAMATKLRLWDLGAEAAPPLALNANGTNSAAAWLSAHGAYDQIAYYDSDHLFLSNADRIFDECGCEQMFCGVWDPRMPAHAFPRKFGSAKEGTYTRRLVNAGMMVVRPLAQYGRHLREWWARRAELLVGSDAGYVITGSDQTWFNYMMGADFNLVGENYNVGHISRKTIINSNGTDFVKFIFLNGTARNESVGTVIHLKPWNNGRVPAETAFHRAVLRRFANGYVRALLKDPRCHARRREVMRVRPEDLAALAKAKASARAG